MHHQIRIDAANKLLRKQKLERKLLLQLKQPVFSVQLDNFTLQEDQTIRSTKQYHHNKSLGLNCVDLVDSSFLS